MKKVLITGGTVFVSKFVADYYVKGGYEVYVLNRNSRAQVKGTNLIEVEQYLLEKVPQAYVLRPPYLYGPMQNLYQELFVSTTGERIWRSEVHNIKMGSYFIPNESF